MECSKNKRQNTAAGKNADNIDNKAYKQISIFFTVRSKQNGRQPQTTVSEAPPPAFSCKGIDWLPGGGRW